MSYRISVLFVFLLSFLSCTKKVDEISNITNSTTVNIVKKNIYPFNEELEVYSDRNFTNIGFVKELKVFHSNGNTKYTNSRTVKKYYLSALSRTLDSISIKIKGQDFKGNYSEYAFKSSFDSISYKYVTYNMVNENLEINVVCDFSKIKQDYHMSFDETTESIIFSGRVIIDESDLFSYQQAPKNFEKGLTENINRKYRNTEDNTNYLYDGSYSWWCRPIAVTRGSHSVLNYVGGFGDQLTYDQRSDNIIAVNTQKLYNRDEHNAAAIYRMSNNKWIYAYTGHQDDGFLRIRVDVDEVNENESKELSYYIGGGLTYAQIVEYNGTLIIATRYNHTSWKILYSKDYGKTWSLPITLIEQTSNFYSLYCLLQMTGSRFIKIYNTFLPNHAQENNRIAYCVLDIETLDVYDKENGDFITNLNVNSVKTDQCKTLYKAASPDYSLRLLDVSGDSSSEALFTVAEVGMEDSSLGSYKFVNYDLNDDSLNVSDIANHGGYFTHSYVGGAYMRQGLQGETDGETIIYTSRKFENKWMIEKWKVTNGLVKLVRLIETSTNAPLVRPISPIGSITERGVEVFYIKGSYVGNSFLDWNTVIKRVYY